MTCKKMHTMVTTRFITPPGGYAYISIDAIMHHEDTEEAVVTNNEI